MAQRIQLRSDSTANWAAANPILAQAEVGVDVTLGKFKIGDGTTTWNNLDFYTGDGGNAQITPLPSFLDYVTARDHLPVLNSNFGWDANGLWFGNAESDGPWGQPSYPVFTDFAMQEFDKVVVTFDMQIDDYCSDLGICVYPSVETPQWAWGTNNTRIAAQFDCTNPEIWGMGTSNDGDSSGDDIPQPGLYRVRFTYDPNAQTERVVFELLVQDGNQFDQISRLSVNESMELNGGTYKIGFASDNSRNDENAQNAPYITYMSNLTININDGETIYTDSLQNGYSGAILNLIAPLVISDANGDNLLRIEKSNVGTTRIHALQDDLALRSARDIILYPGDDGPGNVYIGWGDANYTPNATNRVATLADIDSNPKTWTASNESQYTIRQASGGVEVTTTGSSTFSTGVGSPTDQVAQTSIQILLSLSDDTSLSAIVDANDIRSITLNVSGNDRAIFDPTRVGDDGTYATWSFISNTPITLNSADEYGLSVVHGGAPMLWWDADNLGFITDSNDYWQFRGAKIEYNAYVNDGGTMIGTIYIANDQGGDTNVTHIETSSGGNDVGALNLWYRKPYGNQMEERRLYLYRTDGEGQLHKIHWTAQVYYATEYYGD